MSGCIDKEFENMLHAYELNLLNEKEQYEFEIHLYNCSSCFEKVEKFQKTANLLQHSPRVRDTLAEIVKTGLTEKNNSAARKKLWPTLIPITIAAMFFAFLILKDWQFNIQPSKVAVAAENRLAIMYFNNLADPSDSLKLGEIATNLLIADLSESHYLNIVSSQRLADILGFLEMEGAKSINNKTASIIADEADAKWLLTGNILASSPKILITTQLLEVESGNILASQKIEGNETDDIFSIVDKLTVQIKNGLNLPSEALFEPDPEIAMHTTDSPQAYRYYLEGIENYNKLYYTEAQKDFELALDYDSTFAMAYYYLANISNVSLISKAVKYSDGASTLDRLYIKALEASKTSNKTNYENLLKEIINQFPDEKNAVFLLGNFYFDKTEYDKAILYLNQAIKFDPKYKMAYNQLAYAYNSMGNFDKALWAIDKYIELAPDEANPLDTKAEIYALNGMLDNAIESYKRALTVKPDFYTSLISLALMYMFNMEYSKADSCLDILISTEDSVQQGIAYKHKCYIPQFQGKFNEALRTTDNIIAEIGGHPYSFYFVKSLIYIAKKDWTMALYEIEKTIELHDIDWPDDKASYRYFRIHILAEVGNMERAIKLTKELRDYVEKSGTYKYSYLYAEGTIAMVQGDYDNAILYFKKSLASQNMFFTNYMLANVYLLAEKYEEATIELEKLNNTYSKSRGYYTIWSTMLHYNLGMAYEHTGQTAKAIEQYSIFLDLWKDADDSIEEIKEAREAITRLQNQS